MVEAGGAGTLLSYAQADAADHVANGEVLRALGITVDPVPHAEAVR